MKKKLIYGILLACTISITSFAQDLNNKVKAGQQTPFENSVASNAGTPANRTLLNEINAKAVRSFMKDYKDVHDAKWYKGDNWFAAYFIRDNIQVKVFYDKAGNYRYTMRSYGESILPKAVRHQVRSNLYDYNIFHVNEISTRGAIIYYIKLEGKTSWRDIKIVDSEIETLQEYFKS